MQRASLEPRANGTRPPSLARWVVACFLLLQGLLGARLTFAQESSPLLNPRPASGDASAPPAEALTHYNRGRELYQAGRYREAVVELEQASRLDPESANLVYNLARVYELLGELDLAIRNYQRYRTMLPASETAELARVESTLQRLEGARDEVVREPSEPKTILVAASPRRRGRADGAFWATASIAASALAAGGVTGLLALQEEREAERFTLGEDGSVEARARLETRADRLALSSDLLMLAGATLGITAILLYALREKPAGQDPQARVQLGALPGGALLFVGGRL